MESAIFGLIGVVLGSLLTLAREWWFQRRQERKDAEFLVILVSRQLDLYVSSCVEVVADEGLYEGQPAIDGNRYAQTSIPKFEPESLEVEWKSLPMGLMYEIFDLPYRAEQARNSVSGAFEYAAMPPDFEEGFEERQYQYAILGIDAYALANRLRAHVGLPHKRHTGNWDPISYMHDKRSEIENLRIARRTSARV